MSREKPLFPSWINYVFFPTEKLNEFIKNESNNENWLTIDDYIEQIKEWNEDLETQNQLIKKYEENREITTEEVEKLENFRISVGKRTRDSLFFFWTPPKNPEGKLLLPEIDNYLFNYLGEWYEVKNWEQKTLQEVEITAVKSIFYNYYWHLAKSSVNGILHHSPHGKVEICSCPDYGINDTFHNFVADYRLDFSLSKIGKENVFDWKKMKVLDKRVPLIVGTLPSHWVKEPEKEQTPWFYENSYSFLAKPLSGEVLHKNTRKKIEWRLVGEWSKEKEEYKLSWKGVYDFLAELGLLNKEMNHFLRTHLTAEIFWRGMKKWEGNFWIIFNGIVINESVNASGNCITVEANGRILFQINESISSKVESNEFLSKAINFGAGVAVGAVSGAFTGGIGAAAAIGATEWAGNVNKEGESNVVLRKAAVIKKQGGILGGALHGAGMGVGHTAATSIIREIARSTENSEVSLQYTFYQFQHKYLYGGARPISMTVSLNQTLLNQFRNRRELKGGMFYDYFNTQSFGEYLDVPGHLKASIISWNANFPYNEWFRDRIVLGVNLRKKIQEIYEMKLSEPKSLPSLAKINFAPLESPLKKIGLDYVYEEGQKLLQTLKTIENSWSYEKDEDISIRREKEVVVLVKEVIFIAQSAFSSFKKNNESDLEDKEIQEKISKVIRPHLFSLDKAIQEEYSFIFEKKSITKKSEFIHQRVFFQVVINDIREYLNDLREIVRKGRETTYKKDVLQSKITLPLDITPEVPLKKFNSEENPNKPKEKN